MRGDDILRLGGSGKQVYPYESQRLPSLEDDCLYASQRLFLRDKDEEGKGSKECSRSEMRPLEIFLPWFDCPRSFFIANH